MRGNETTARHLPPVCGFSEPPTRRAVVNMRVKRASDGECVCITRDIPLGRIGETGRALRSLFGDGYVVRVDLLGWDSAGEAVMD